MLATFVNNVLILDILSVMLLHIATSEVDLLDLKKMLVLY